MNIQFTTLLYRLALAMLVATISLQTVKAQDDALLTLERIFSSNEFSSESFGSSQWLDEGEGYTTLEPSIQIEGGQDIVRYSTNKGNREILISSAHLIPEGASNPISIRGYEWSADKSKLLIFTNTQRVWRYHTRGDYWVLDVQSSELHQLGSDLPESSLMFAKFSPQSDRVAYVSEHNIYIENLNKGEVTQLTSDGTEYIINGTFDWAYEEEFGARDGFQWSPDGQKIAYWQLDASDIQDFLMINNTDSIYSYTIPVQYPKVGQDNSACKVGIIATSGGQTQWMNVPGDPKNNYIPRMLWSPDTKGIYIQHLNRHQNTNEVMYCEASSGKVKTVYTDTDEAWLDVVDDWQWINEGKQFSWISEKNGWQHVYLISPENGEETDITPWEFDVISIARIDEKGGWLYFIASPDNATQRYLYRSKLNRKGKAERLSPAGQAGTHSYNISPNAKWAIHTYSAAGLPPGIALISLPKHQIVKSLEENEKLKNKVSQLKKSSTEFFKVTTDGGVEMDAYMMKPYDFDPSRKYPVLFHVYGEPAGQTVVDRWGGSNYLWHLMLTQQGYIVISMDNRGTPAPKGRDWRKSIYGKIGIISSQDQAGGLREILKTYDFVDVDRIGVWGWSGGGSMTLNMMFRYPELYHTGMSVAPVGNQLLYDNIYQERYMGLPWENEEGYKEGSPLTFAKNLKGNLLIVHGTGDDNVHYQNTEVIVNELIRHNKFFSMMAYPNRSHGIYEGENTSRHLRELLTHYLKTHLPAGPKNEVTNNNTGN
ncbi:S9 family peptidase [Catalinimonas niigatensis]|uniref:S9 family peptidase n=1 Tax=Catalinimonas niigatensis TaxID=1397264 RepID=UPI002665BB35|nr:S9 family peptidase [Catalinimonas niigatensis]WPP50832.1 DPP IV N-terminal domain-containing protein [Catalinimonas niigatensis]